MAANAIGTDDAFSRDYAEARSRFVAAAADARAGLTGYSHPLAGPSGEALALDAAYFGRTDAPKVLVTISATHGVEGFCGAALQLDRIRTPTRLHPDIAVLHLHALNPHGFAWLRRVDADGIDLNRNFIDFERPLPADAGYAALHDALVPAARDARARAEADAVLARAGARLGQRGLESAVSSGQYTHPVGLFYGGTCPSWSRRQIEAVFADYNLARRALVAVVDIHTGLGPYGHGEVICDHAPGSPETTRGRAWYGAAMTEPALGTSSSVPKRGLLDYAWQAALGRAVTFVTLEFGTYPVAAMLVHLRADHMLHRQGVPVWDAPATRRIKRELRRHFFPDTARWRRMVMRRGREVLGQALAGLEASEI